MREIFFVSCFCVSSTWSQKMIIPNLALIVFWLHPDWLMITPKKSIHSKLWITHDGKTLTFRVDLLWQYFNFFYHFSCLWLTNTYKKIFHPVCGLFGAKTDEFGLMILITSRCWSWIFNTQPACQPIQPVIRFFHVHSTCRASCLSCTFLSCSVSASWAHFTLYYSQI